MASNRHELLHGPYQPPTLQRGNRTTCLLRDAEVAITSWTDAPISWPRCQRVGVRGGSGLLVTEERVIKDGPVPENGVKNVEFVTRKPGMAVDVFQQYWSQVHGPLAALIPVVRRYVQSHTRRAAYEAGRAPLYDGAALTWFDDTQAMRASAATAEYARVRADEANFITANPPFIITREHVIVA